MRNQFLAGCVFTGLTLTLANPSPAATDVELSTHGLDIRAADGKLDINLGGRLHIDAASFDDDVTPLDPEHDIDFRRARLELSIKLLDDFRFRLDYDFADLSRGFKNVWGSWEFADGYEIQLGNFTAPFSLEDVSSSNNTTFMERSLPNTMAPGFLLGGAVSGHGEDWTAAIGFFREPIDLEEDTKETEGDGVTARVTVVPWREGNQLIHLGAGIEARDLDSGTNFRVRTRPEAALAGGRLIDTGSLANVDQYTTINLEAAWRGGPFSLQSQYLHMWVDRSGVTQDPEFAGWYAQASWIVTGEQRGYSNSSGVFTSVDVDKSDFGAIELAVRYSTLDLEDATVTGGEENNWTLGVNWYVTDYLRLMANYVHAEAEPNRTGVDEEVEIGQMRLQLNL